MRCKQQMTLHSLSYFQLGVLLLFNRSHFKTYYKATVIKTVWYWHKGRHTDQWNRIKNPEINPHIYGQLIFDKSCNIIQWESIIFSTSGAGTTGEPHAKEWIWTPTSHRVQRWTQTEELKVGAKSIKFLEENITVYLCDTEFGSGFLDMPGRG